MIWDNKQVNISCLVVTNQLIHCSITEISSSELFYATFVYGYNSAQERISLWSDIRSIDVMPNPWIIARDMNTTLFPDVRVKNGAMIDSDLSELTSVVEDLSLLDLRYSRNKLT